MYGDKFGTNWDRLDRESAVRRAYALGVQTALGDPKPDEYRRVRHAGGSAYERTLIELSYHEGIRDVKQFESGTESDPSTIWTELVHEEAPSALANRADHTERGLPDSLSSLPQQFNRTDPADAVRLPEFLRWR